MKEQTRWWILLGVTLTAVIGLCFAPRIAQWPDYHYFADQRTICGVHHFMDVVSNIPFLLVAAMGFIALWRQSKAREFQDRAEMWPYLSFFTAVLLTAFGSSYYHLLPNNTRLVWDRIPMTMVVMSLVAIILMEKINSKFAVRALTPLLILGIGSVVYWIWTESMGRGDLRLYGFVLFYPVVLIPLVLFLFPKPFPAANELVRLAVYYGLAKLFEAKDLAVYAVTKGIISGHTLKHLVAAFSLFWVVRMLQKRNVKKDPILSWGAFPGIVLAIALVCSCLLFWTNWSFPYRGPFQEGDIVFQDLPCDQSEAVKLATHSQYSHVGIILPNPYDGKLYVYEAVGPVKFTSIQDWIKQGEGSHFVAKRLKNPNKVLSPKTLKKMEDIGLEFYGKPYDWIFQWSDDRMYCSELVWKIYQKSTSLEVGKLQKLKNFDFSNPQVKDLLKERYGDRIPWNESVISPEQMFESDLLTTVISK